MASGKPDDEATSPEPQPDAIVSAMLQADEADNSPQTPARWWHAPRTEWPLFRRLTDKEWEALFPPCWTKDAGGEIVHTPKEHWTECPVCHEHLSKSSPTGLPHLPSPWVCRCRRADLFWRHQEDPHVDVLCHICEAEMTKEGIFMEGPEGWHQQCRRQNLIAEKKII